MSSNAANQARRVAAAIVAIAVTALLHGGWLADLSGSQRTPAVAVRTA